MSYRIGTMDCRDPKAILKVRQFISETGPVGFQAFERDKVVVAMDSEDRIQGLFAHRPVILLHEFRIKPVVGALRIAEGLVNYALGAANASGYTECLMLIDKPNQRMIDFACGIGAKQDPGYDNSNLYYFPIR